MRKAVLALVLLAGCATSNTNGSGHSFSSEKIPPAGKYANAEQWMSDSLRQSSASDVLDALPNDGARADYLHCAWLYMTADLTPPQLGNLDDYARGQTGMWSDTKSALYTRISGPAPSRGDYSFLQPFCPDKIQEFQSAG